MARRNAGTERHPIEIADLAQNDVVLVVGFGPGIGLREAGARSANVMGVDPLPAMLAAALRGCADSVSRGRIGAALGTAEDAGLAEGTADVVLSVNNVQLWSCKETIAGFAVGPMPGVVNESAWYTKPHGDT